MYKTDQGKRRKMIQLIHIAKGKAMVCAHCGNLHFNEKCPDCGQSDFISLGDDAYREILYSLVLKNSASQMSMAELNKTLSFFQDCGFVIKSKSFNVNKELEIEKKRVKDAILEKAPGILGENYQLRLDGIIKYIGRSSLDFCNMQDLRRIHGFLSSIQKKGKAV